MIGNNDRFYSEKELEVYRKNFIFGYLGRNVKIARTATITNPRDTYIMDNAVISDYALITGSVRIGAYTHIAHYVHVSGSKAKIYIGDYTGISARTSFYSSNDDWSGKTLASPCPDEYRNPESGDIIVGDYVLMGFGCIILPNTVIGDNCIFGKWSYIKGQYEANHKYFYNDEKVAPVHWSKFGMERYYIDPEPKKALGKKLNSIKCDRCDEIVDRNNIYYREGDDDLYFRDMDLSVVKICSNCRICPECDATFRKHHYWCVTCDNYDDKPEDE